MTRQRLIVSGVDHSAQTGRHRLSEHPGDRYDTPPIAVEALLNVERDFFRLPRRIWEPAAGCGNIVLSLRAAGHEIVASDLNDRGCPDCIDRIDFLLPMECRCDAIITNPPYALAERFVQLAIERAPMVMMLLRLAFLESERRAPLLDGSLSRVHVFARRLPMMHREGWTGRKASSAIPFAWFVWDRNHQGPTTIDRI